MSPSSAPIAPGWRFGIGIMVPVALSLVVTTAVTLGFIIWSTEDVDERMLARQTGLARHVIDTQLERLPHDQRSVALWDDAVLRTKLSFDRPWVEHHLGRWMHAYFHHDGALVLDQRNELLYAMEEGETLDLAATERQLVALAPLIAELRARLATGDPPARAALHQVVDLATIGSRPALVSVAPLVSHSRAITQDPGTEFLHVSLVYLDTAFAARLSAEYQVPGLSFTTEPSQAPNRVAIPLTNADGRIVTFLEWERARPGLDLFNRTIPVIAGALLIAGMLIFLLIDQIWRKSRALEAGRADAERRAAHDALTELPNRASFETALTTTLSRTTSRDRRVSVLILDLDRFKQVNDTLGHRAGDDLLRGVGQRLGQLLGPDDILSRLGGDEFAIIHLHGVGLGEVLRLSQRIVDAVSKPFLLSGNEAFVGVSIGIATADIDERDAHDLTRKADIALYEAKASGRNRAVVFEESMNEFIQNRKTIEAELREALRSTDQLSVAFQPLVGRNGQVVGAEALSRWSHPRLGHVSPAHFIPVAEATGLVEQLGAFVLRTSCELGARWPGYTIAVNISPVQLRNPHFPAEVFRLLAETGMRPSDLELEVTEGILLEEESDSAEALRVFRAAGIRIALDDFGTGYSSLNYVKRYPVDRIKIDRAFVSQLAAGNVSVAIVQAMVTLAHALKVEVTAEGVETEAQRAILLELGCNVVQGYLLGAPVAGREMEALFARPVAAVA